MKSSIKNYTIIFTAIVAGTVLTGAQVDQVAAAGAAFAVSPGFNPEIVSRAREINLPFAPGVCTPSDIEAALTLNCSLLKFFPAETSGGVKHLKSMSAPYNHLNLQFMPLGGLNQDNAASYLSLPQVIAVGGSWIAKSDLINKNEWSTITANAKAAVKAVN